MQKRLLDTRANIKTREMHSKKKKEERLHLTLAFFLPGLVSLKKPVVNYFCLRMSLQLNYALLFMQALKKAKKNKPFEPKKSFGIISPSGT
jgi:hypothetical protein